MVIFSCRTSETTNARPLLNLRSVLEHAAKRNTKARGGSTNLTRVLSDVVDHVWEWECDDVFHTLWRRAFVTCYSQVRGGSNYSPFETLHVGLRLPVAIFSVGTAHPVSISN